MSPGLETLTSLGRTVFRHNRMDDICPEKLVPTAAHFLCRSLPTRLRMSYRPIFAHGLTSLGRRVFRHNRIDAICLEKPVPTAIHSHYIASSQRSSPQAISHGFPSVHPVVTSASLLPNGALSMLYFPRFPLRPPCRRFRIAPSPRSSPQPISFPSTLSSLPYAIYHGFPSVHLLVASVSLLSNGPLPKLFPTVSLPSTLSSLPSRSFGTELSPSYFPLSTSTPTDGVFLGVLTGFGFAHVRVLGFLYFWLPTTLQLSLGEGAFFFCSKLTKGQNSK